jgi:Cu2+-exporting ATPase
MIFMGIEVLLGVYIGSRVIEKYFSNKKQKEEQSKPEGRDQKELADVVIMNEDKSVDNYVNISTVSLISSAISFFFPNLRLFSLVILSCSSIPIFKLAEHSLIKEKRVRNDLLNVVIVVGCIATNRLFIGSLDVWLFNFGSKMVSKIQGRSKEMLTNLFEEQPDKAWILKDNMEIEMPLESLCAKDIVIVKTGEVIPVDGIITDGAAMIDQHILTGESVPAEKGVGDKVFASTLIVKGRICVEVEKAGWDTTVSKLGDILNNTADFKSGLQLKGEIWADKIAPLLLGTGGLSLPLIGSSPAMAVINSGTGNALRILASLQTLNHLILASKRGILVKDGRALEALAGVDTVIFDKTGTLTNLHPIVGEIITCGDEYEEDDILIYAAAAERRVSHPFAKAVLAKADEHKLILPDPDDSEYQVGYGITVQLENKIIRVGSIRFMKMESITIPGKIEELMEHSHIENYSLIAVAANSQIIGAIEIHPQVRPEAKKIINGLRQRGVRDISIISGDHCQPTQKLAEFFGTDSYYYDVLPEDKADIVEKLQEEGKTVCFIGDGINDAIAMKKANVSVSLSGASSVATDVAQVILMDGTLLNLCHLFDISYELEDNLRQSLILADGGGIVNFGGAVFFGLGILGSNILLSFIFGTGIALAMRPLKQLQKEHKDDPGSENTAYLEYNDE